MKHTRVIVTHYGGPDVLQVLEEERPEPEHGQVRVRVLSAGVAFPLDEARHAHESLGKGGVIGKIVLDVSSLESGVA